MYKYSHYIALDPNPLKLNKSKKHTWNLPAAECFPPSQISRARPRLKSLLIRIVKFFFQLIDQWMGVSRFDYLWMVNCLWFWPSCSSFTLSSLFFAKRFCNLFNLRWKWSTWSEILRFSWKECSTSNCSYFGIFEQGRFKDHSLKVVYKCHCLCLFLLLLLCLCVCVFFFSKVPQPVS